MDQRLKRIVLILAGVQALCAVLGSLYFSEILHLIPCTLCWYQRVMMYLLVVIFIVGLFRKDQRVALYALPLSIIGLCISTYHSLLYYGVIPEHARFCAAGISCTTVQVEWLHFITIPLLALVAFFNISVLLILSLRQRQSM